MVDISWMNNRSPSGAGRPTEGQRRIVDKGWEDNRLPPADNATAARNPPKTVERALREDCHIEVKEYFLATVLRDGNVEYFSSSSECLAPGAIPNIFNMGEFQRAVGPPELSGIRGEDLPPMGSRTSRRGRPGARTGRLQFTAPTSRPQRTTGSRSARDQAMPSPVRKIPLRISNSEGVWEFYLLRFKSMHQNACKLIAKAWIRAVAPKKQSSYPYTGKEAPDWWPKPWGPTPFEMVRFTEPDHLRKWERIPLCAHLLRLVVENQHPEIRKQNLSVAKFEEISRDALHIFFNESPNNEAKRPFLREVIKVARMEEQYKRGEIDGNTDVYVVTADSIPADEDEDEDEIKAEYPSPSPMGTISSESNLAISINNNQSQMAPIPSPNSMMTLPSPSPHYPPGALISALSPDQSPYMEHPTPMEIDDTLSSRRTSTYTSSPSEYASSLGPQVPLYPPSTAGPAWQSTTTAPSSSSLFAFSHSQIPLAIRPLQPQSHSQTHSSGYVTHMDVQLGQSQYLGSPFDGLPNPNSAFRSAGGNAGHGPAPGYGQRDYGH